MSEDPLAAWLAGFVRDAGFLAAYPYYAALLGRVTPVADPSVAVMGVSLHERGYYLHVNVDYFLRDPRYLRGVLLHEVHHVALGHLGHTKFRSPAHPELMEVAMEVSANEYIEEALPDPLTWQHLREYGLEAGQSTIERYELLVRAKLAGRLAAPGASFVDDHGAGGGFGLRAGDRPPPANAHETTRALLDEGLREGRRTERHAKAGGAKLAGRTPGEVLEALDPGGRLPPFVDWKDALRVFVARARAPHHVYTRPSRRAPGRLGEVPGRSYVSRAHDKLSLIIAIDTSLSMSRDELNDVAVELVPLRDHARLRIVECDVTVRRVYEFDGHLRDVLGRGGTDLRPTFDPTFYRPFRPDGIVYFTDGEGPFPNDEPAVRTLWVLTKPNVFPCPWGARARLERERRGPR